MFQWLSDMYGKAKEAVTGPVQTAVNPSAVPVGVPSDIPSETTGTTTVGGKMCGGRRRKTHRSKKSKKTLRRKR
jgi:hypothetical protein